MNFRRKTIEEIAIRCNEGDDQIKNEEIRGELRYQHLPCLVLDPSGIPARRGGFETFVWARREECPRHADAQRAIHAEGIHSGENRDEIRGKADFHLLSV